jgi:hypothetical protein
VNACGDATGTPQHQDTDDSSNGVGSQKLHLLLISLTLVGGLTTKLTDRGANNL